MEVPQIKYLVQGEAEFEMESRDDWEERVNKMAVDLNATKIQIFQVPEIDRVEVTDAGNGDRSETHDYEYDGFNIAVIHYLKEISI